LRSVSKEAVTRFLTLEGSNYLFNPNINFFYAASFQLHDYQKKITHGWIGILKDKEIKLYHVIIPYLLTRVQYLNIISNLGIDLIYSYVDKNYKVNTPYIDMVYNYTDTFVEKQETAVEILKNSSEEGLLVFETNGSLIRFEDLLRECNKGLIIQRGSYNPIHEGHLEIMKVSKNKYPDHLGVFMLSIDRFDKPSLSVEEIIERVKKINSLGYKVIVSKLPLFVDGLKLINEYRKRYPTIEILFPVGVDTINRFINPIIVNAIAFKTANKGTINFVDEEFAGHLTYQDYFEKFPTKFLVFERKGFSLTENITYFNSKMFEYIVGYEDSGISSTKIRNHESETKI